MFSLTCNWKNPDTGVETFMEKHDKRLYKDETNSEIFLYVGKKVGWESEYSGCFGMEKLGFFLLRRKLLQGSGSERIKVSQLHPNLCREGKYMTQLIN